MADEASDNLDKQSNKLYLQQNAEQSNHFKLPKLPTPPSRGRFASRKQNRVPASLPQLTNQKSQQSEKESSNNDNFRNTDIINLPLQKKGQREQILKDDFALQMQEKLKQILSKANKNQNQKQTQNKSSRILMQKNSSFSTTQKNQNNNQTTIKQTKDQQDDSDFQAKINQNKAIIKMHREKNEKKQKKGEMHSTKSIQQSEKNINFNKSKPRTMVLKPTKLSNYEKKMKQYNNSSLQNKFLQRKKQSMGIVSAKQNVKPLIERKQSTQRIKSGQKFTSISMKDALDEMRNDFGYKQFKGNKNLNAQLPKKPEQKKINNGRNDAIGKSHRASGNKHTLQKRKTQQTSPTSKKSINLKSDSLFDNIQNFLENPTSIYKHQRLYNQLSKKLKVKDLTRLEEKIKEINQKLGQNNGENHQIQSQRNSLSGEDRPFLLTQSPLERTVRDWKRIQINGKKDFNCQQSNFQKELDYVNTLQEKNTTSLSKFVDHQKIIVQLQLRKYFTKNHEKDLTQSL